MFQGVCGHIELSSHGKWGFVHIAQCRGLVTNGSNHWILITPTIVAYLAISTVLSLGCVYQAFMTLSAVSNK